LDSLQDISEHYRYKDRKSRASRLTNDESFIFQRGLYRLWLYSAVYGAYKGQPPSATTDEQDVVDDNGVILDLETAKPRRQLFLASFGAPDLDVMENVSSFVTGLATWVIRANHRGTGEVFSLFFTFGLLYHGSDHQFSSLIR
jgi:hypothetical protein